MVGVPEGITFKSGVSTLQMLLFEIFFQSYLSKFIFNILSSLEVNEA